MKNIVIAAIVFASFAGNAFALTLKSGEVLSSNGEVVKASESENGQRRLAQDGVLVSGGVVYIDLNGHVVEVPVNEIAGASKDRIKEIIGEAAVEQLQDLYDDAEAHAAEIGGVNAVGKSVDQILEEIDLDAAEGAIVGVSEQMHEQINAALEKIDGEKIKSEAEVAAELGVSIEELRSGCVGC